MDKKLLDAPISRGARLKSLRVKNEWSLEDVASNLNLRPEVVKALESDDYSMLPERTYVRGYLRAYARLLGIHDHEALEDLKDLPEIKRSRGGLGSVLPVMGEAELRSAQHVPKSAVFKSTSRSWIRSILISVLVLVLILVAWWVSGFRPSTVSGGSSKAQNNQDGSVQIVTLPEVNVSGDPQSGN
jgi:cytoskeletal protein RodZ